jgi:nitrogen fixation protein FixH
MKIHWGSGIVGVFVLFAAIVLTMVWVAMHQKIDLVTEDYYDQELKHEDRIDAVARTKRSGQAPAITLNGRTISIVFPPSVDRKRLEGRVECYRPSDKALDFRTPIELDSTNTCRILTASMTPGRWRLKLLWTVGGESFYDEQAVMVIR